MGERLFLETRFAQFFFTNSGGDANYQLPAGDPVMDFTQTLQGPVPGPFAGQSMNCRACHLVDEKNSTLGNRTYCDFTPRSPIPRIHDGRVQTPRNSPTLVNALLPRPGPLFLHLDGQFASPHDLIIATLTGRNYGWRPTEYTTAIAHIAHIIRDDDGMGELARGIFGGGYSYSQVLNPTADVEITKNYRLNYQYTLGELSITDPTDPGYVPDEVIIEDVAALIEVYLNTLVFAQDLNGAFVGSPYDVFLIKNGLPQQPDSGETASQYSQRLLHEIEKLPDPQFVSDPGDGQFTTHTQTFRFGPRELEGLKVFFRTGDGHPHDRGRTGNCVACHSPPDFTDFVFHNTGATQEEYDAIHGRGAFNRLPVPNFFQRQRNHDAYLPPTPEHPEATGRFITPPSRLKPGEVDLGLWNVFANPDFPAPQDGLQQVMLGLIPGSRLHIGGTRIAGTRFVFGITNGIPAGTYRLLASADPNAPMTDWEAVSTNTLDTDGCLNFTNAILPAASRFFTVAPMAAPPAFILPHTIARFKTPTVRDLGHSQPYLHSGRMDTIEDVVRFYQEFSEKSRAGLVRNADPELREISVDDHSAGALAAFLRALNEDYTD